MPKPGLHNATKKSKSSHIRQPDRKEVSWDNLNLYDSDSDDNLERADLPSHDHLHNIAIASAMASLCEQRLRTRICLRNSEESIEEIVCVVRVAGRHTSKVLAELRGDRGCLKTVQHSKIVFVPSPLSSSAQSGQGWSSLVRSF